MILVFTLLPFLVGHTLSLDGLQSCPPGCFCDRKKVDSLLPILEGLRVHCVQMSNEKFNPRRLPNNTLQLDLNGYGLKAITSDFFRNVKYLEKVDLSNNHINFLDEEALHSLGYLKSLDLSYNELAVLTMDTLVGLTSLERLKLNNNKLQTIEFGAFSHLSNIQKIDLSDNPLLCDCNLAWLVDQDHWLDIAGARARCGAPEHLVGASIKKLSVSEMTCSVPMLPTYNSKLDMRLEPGQPQVVFTGDSLRLICHVGLLTNEIMVRWFHNDKLLDHSSVTSITELGPSKHRPSLSKQSQLYIGSLEEEHSGNWTCSALVDTGHVQNTSVGVAVISAGVVLCPASSTNSSKGVYQWGVTMAGSLATQHCHNTSQETQGGSGSGQQSSVTYQCQQDGSWGVINDTACGHTSDVTDKLYRFAYMNNSDFDQNTLIQSARKLLEFTSVSVSFQDGMDIVYLSRVLENYLPYLSSNSELASLLVDIAANAMRMSPEIIYQGQLLGHAASRLIATIANISRIIPAFQHQRSSLAIESFNVSPKSFVGITCSWYSEAGDRLLHCSDNNVTLANNHGRTILGSAQLPGTLYYQLELHDRDVNIAQNIMFTALQNATFFPQISSHKESEAVVVFKVVSDCVLGASLVAAEPFNLSEPVYIIMKLRPGLEYSSDIVPGWWDPRSNNGLGAWQTQHCKVMKPKKSSVVFSCNRLGFYALLSRAPREHVHKVEVASDSGVTVSQLSRYTPVHSAVYTTTIISVILLCTTVCMFTYLYSRIEITKKLKHALPNFWMSLLFFIVFYALSISVQSARPLCQCVGLLLHYFILTTFLWLTIVANIVYKKLVNPRDMAANHSTNPYVLNPEEEVYIAGQKRLRKPIGQYYLVGWGVPLIVCGITAGASLQQYTQSGYDWCFLSLAPAIGAILIPVVLISLIYLFFIIAILSFSSSKLETKLVSSSGSSSSTLMVTDSQHSHRSHSSVLVMVYTLVVTMMVCAVLSVTAPLPPNILATATQHSVFSVLYSGLTCLLSLVILVYYALMRHDIVHCKWTSHTVQDETSNLVELNNHRQVQTMQPQHNTYIMDNMIKPAYQPMELGGSVLGPSSGGRLKQCNLERSEEDFHSLNNSQHLSRPLAMEANTMTMFGPSAKVKVNNVNIHMAEEPQGWYDQDWSVSRQCYQRPPAPSIDHGSPVSPMELPYPDISHLIINNSGTVSNSLPRKSARRHDRRRRNVNGIQSDVERADQIYCSSRFSEVSSSTAASVSLSKSSRSKKNKPRRKPRKRSEVFPTSSSGGSGSKRYDPIMEVSYTMDNEEEDLEETNNLLPKPNNFMVDDIDDLPGEDVCHNNTDNEEAVDDDIIDGDESLASKLLNRETCV